MQVDVLQKLQSQTTSLATRAAPADGRDPTVPEKTANTSQNDDDGREASASPKTAEDFLEGSTIRGGEGAEVRGQGCPAAEAMEHQEDQNTWWSRAIAATLLIGPPPPYPTWGCRAQKIRHTCTSPVLPL